MMETALTVAWSAAAAGMAGYAAAVARQVTYVTLADGRKQERALPLTFKMLLPFAGNLRKTLAKPAFARRAAAMDKKLVAAGFEGLLGGTEFVALEILGPLVMGAAWCLSILMLGSVFPDSLFVSMRLELCFAGAALLALQPSLWLKGALKKRHAAIAKALPFMLDVLTLSVEAGLDFIGALQRNCGTRKMDPLNEELLRMTKEIQLGASRKAALKRMGERCAQPDLKAFASALVQADELGVSIGSMLRIQADQMRAKRFDRAEKLAHETPVKILGPLMLCIFPAVFIILLGPVLTQAMKGLL